MNDLLSQAALRPSPVDQLWGKLREVRGVEITDGHRACWNVGGKNADMSLDSVGDLRIQLPFSGSLVSPSATRGQNDMRTALEITSTLPGNLRFARLRNVLMLVADIPNEFRFRLDEALGELQQGFSLARRSDNSEQEIVEPPIDKSEIQSALRQPPWDDQTVVELQHGWELRPRCVKPGTVVTMTVVGRTMRLRRTIISQLPDQDFHAAVFAQAIRSNAQLKHARLACSGGELVAEVRIHQVLLDGVTLATAARAVALAEERVHAPLAILNTHPEIASSYETLVG